MSLEKATGQEFMEMVEELPEGSEILVEAQIGSVRSLVPVSLGDMLDVLIYIDERGDSLEKVEIEYEVRDYLEVKHVAIGGW